MGRRSKNQFDQLARLEKKNDNPLGSQPHTQQHKKEIGGSI